MKTEFQDNNMLPAMASFVKSTSDTKKPCKYMIRFSCQFHRECVKMSFCNFYVAIYEIKMMHNVFQGIWNEKKPMSNVKQVEPYGDDKQ